jgi:ornithine decarboxylase
MDFKIAEQLVRTHGTPTLFLSASRLRESYRSLAAALPGVELFYAVKSNACPDIITILAQEGASFDVCTNAEIDAVRAGGVTAGRCLHTHPIKTARDIEYALRFGISLFVVDNEWELNKFIPFKDRAQLLIRMSIQNPHCMVNLSHKFGIPPEKAWGLIESAREMGLSVKGLSFHAGSQNESPLKYIEALEYCRDIAWKSAVAGTPLEIIDIGGGFPINYLNPVLPPAQFCREINEYIERYFMNYRVIAEPGRILSGPSMTLAARVIGKALRDGVRWYYLDEGVYGSFSGKIYDHCEYPMSIARAGDKFTSVIAGPTCDSIDVLYENLALPEMEIGDLILFDSMGAYTSASASNFNGYEKAAIVVVE